MITEDFALENRLRDYGQALSTEVRATPALHSSIMMRVDGAAPARPRRWLMQASGVAALLLVAAGVYLVNRYIHDQALASAAPSVAATVPADGTRDVPLVGQLNVRFQARPSEMPTVRLSPAGVRLDAPQWQGDTLVVTYAGLRPSTAYEATVEVGYRSRFGDRGHFERPWRFTAAGPAQITSTVPAGGTSEVARTGQISVQFAHRPPVDPVVSLQPVDGRLDVGAWNGSTYVIPYQGLQPLRSYRMVLDVDLGSSAGNVHREWSFTTEPGAPPAGVPLIWFSTSVPPAPGGPSEPPVSRLMALDWSGTLRGTLYETGVPLQSPDGSRLLSDRYLDQAGNMVAAVAGTKGRPTLSDDNRHFCALLSATGSDQLNDGEATWLFAGPIGSSPRRIAQFGSVGGQSGPQILACSYLADRAVVSERAVMGVTEVRSIAISTGRTIYDRPYASDRTATVIASHDGRYTAEQTTHIDAQGNIVSDATIIRLVPDGVVLASLDHWSVVAFSWDGSKAVVVPAVGFPPVVSAVNEVRVIEWRTSRVLWRTTFAGTLPFAHVLARPGGGDFAIRIGADDVAGPADTLWLVAADGTAKQVRSGPVGSAF